MILLFLDSASILGVLGVWELGVSAVLLVSFFGVLRFHSGAFREGASDEREAQNYIKGIVGHIEVTKDMLPYLFKKIENLNENNASMLRNHMHSKNGD